MFEQVVPVNKDRHAGKKIRSSNDFRFAAKFHVAYVTVHEFARAAAIYPTMGSGLAHTYPPSSAAIRLR